MIDGVNKLNDVWVQHQQLVNAYPDYTNMHSQNNTTRQASSKTCPPKSLSTLLIRLNTCFLLACSGRMQSEAEAADALYSHHLDHEALAVLSRQRLRHEVRLWQSVTNSHRVRRIVGDCGRLKDQRGVLERQ